MAGGVIPRTAARIVGRGINAPTTGVIQSIERGRAGGAARGRRASAPPTDGWTTVSAADTVTNASATAINSSLSGLTIGGPRRKGDFRVSLNGWDLLTSGDIVTVFFGATLISSGGAHIDDDGRASLLFRWWIGGGGPWDPLPLISVGFPATPLTQNPSVTVALDYEVG